MSSTVEQTIKKIAALSESITKLEDKLKTQKASKAEKEIKQSKAEIDKLLTTSIDVETLRYDFFKYTFIREKTMELPLLAYCAIYSLHNIPEIIKALPEKMRLAIATQTVDDYPLINYLRGKSNDSYVKKLLSYLTPKERWQALCISVNCYPYNLKCRSLLAGYAHRSKIALAIALELLEKNDRIKAVTKGKVLDDIFTVHSSTQNRQQKITAVFEKLPKKDWPEWIDAVFAKGIEYRLDYNDLLIGKLGDLKNLDENRKKLKSVYIKFLHTYLRNEKRFTTLLNIRPSCLSLLELVNSEHGEHGVHRSGSLLQKACSVEASFEMLLALLNEEEALQALAYKAKGKDLVAYVLNEIKEYPGVVNILLQNLKKILVKLLPEVRKTYVQSKLNEVAVINSEVFKALLESLENDEDRIEITNIKIMLDNLHTLQESLQVVALKEAQDTVNSNSNELNEIKEKVVAMKASIQGALFSVDESARYDLIKKYRHQILKLDAGLFIAILNTLLEADKLQALEAIVTKMIPGTTGSSERPLLRSLLAALVQYQKTQQASVTRGMSSRLGLGIGANRCGQAVITEESLAVAEQQAASSSP